MTMQPAEVYPADAILWATGYFRTFLAGRTEPFATGVSVVKDKPAENRPRIVSVTRDGGPLRGLVDNPRLRIRVWADKDKDAADLARLLIGAISLAPGNGPVLSVTNIFGPTPIPDSSQPQYLVNTELRLRCLPL